MMDTTTSFANNNSPKTKEYAIVLFTDSDEISLIPQAWIQAKGDECLWPSSCPDGKVMKLIENCVKCNAPPHHWEAFKIRPLRQNIDSYERAKEVEEKSLETSDLASDTNTISPKRKRRQPQRFISPSDSDQSEQKTASQASAGFTASPQKSMPNLPPELPPTLVKKKLLFSRKEKPADTPPTPLPSPVAPLLKNGVPASKESCSQSESKNRQVPASASVSQGESCSDPQNVQMTESKRKWDSFSNDEKLYHLFDSLQQLNKPQSKKPKLNRPVDNDPLSSYIPIDSKEKFEALEQKCAAEDKAFKKKLIAGIKTKKKDRAEDTIRAVCKYLMVDSFAMAYSYVGHKKKIPFEPTFLNQLIFDTMAFFFPGVTDQTVIDTVSKWLAQAKFRIAREEKCKRDRDSKSIATANPEDFYD